LRFQDRLHLVEEWSGDYSKNQSFWANGEVAETLSWLLTKRYHIISKDSNMYCIRRRIQGLKHFALVREHFLLLIFQAEIGYTGVRSLLFFLASVHQSWTWAWWLEEIIWVETLGQDPRFPIAICQRQRIELAKVGTVNIFFSPLNANPLIFSYLR